MQNATKHNCFDSVVRMADCHTRIFFLEGRGADNELQLVGCLVTYFYKK